MISERDAGRIVREWLGDGEPILPAHVFQAVLDDVPRVRQRRRLRDRWPAASWSVAAALTLLAVALLGLALATGAWRSLLPAPDPRPFPTAEGQRLEAGRYVVDAPFPVRISLDVPAGWVAEERTKGIVVLAPDRLAAPVLVFTTADGVYRDPCHPELGLEEPLGPTPLELATALAARPSITASSPTVASIAGRPALSVTLRAPERASGCTPNDPSLPLWAFPEVVGLDPGETARIDILEVDGVRLVVLVGQPAGMVGSEMARVDEVVASIRLGADAAALRAAPSASPASAMAASPEPTPPRLPDHGRLDAGFYWGPVQRYGPGATGGSVALSPPGALALAVPNGWFGAPRGIRSREDRPSARLEAWSVLAIHPDPCGRTSEPARPAPLDDLDALATILRTAWSPVSADATNATITAASSTRQAWNARHAWSFELAVAMEAEPDSCEGGRLALWTSPEGDTFTVDPGDRVRLWVIDLEPGLVVLSLVFPSDASVAETQALLEAAASTWIGVP